MSTQENLEERIERIRKRNEELQKKHAEAEADKQRAKKENAMVQTKPTNYDDWPREHKYDNVDFTFDKNEDIHMINDEIRDRKREKHNKSQFAEGDGPPPDPSYSFLKDADRDYNHIEQIHNKTNASKKSQHSNPRNQRGNQERNSFSDNSRGKHRKDFIHNNSQPAYDAWRCERNKIDEARINRQKNSEGKWRREWDIEKINNDGPKEIFNTHKPEKYTIGDALITGTKKTIMAHPNMDKSKDFNRARPNITVSLDRSGEVQSVKVSSPPAIGSGRVGPRQVKTRPAFPDEMIDNKKNDSNDRYKSIPERENFHNKRKDRIKSPNTDGQVNAGSGVQDRLNKYKKHNNFSEISKEIKSVTQEIQGICTSVENLNMKHVDSNQSDSNLDEKIIDNILNINTKKEMADDFCLSTDLIIGTKDTTQTFQNKENDLACDFVNMATSDIEKFIEKEVEKNNIYLQNTIVGNNHDLSEEKQISENSNMELNSSNSLNGSILDEEQLVMDKPEEEITSEDALDSQTHSSDTNVNEKELPAENNLKIDSNIDINGINELSTSKADIDGQNKETSYTSNPGMNHDIVSEKIELKIDIGDTKNNIEEDHTNDIVGKQQILDHTGKNESNADNNVVDEEHK